MDEIVGRFLGRLDATGLKGVVLDCDEGSMVSASIMVAPKHAMRTMRRMMPALRWLAKRAEDMR